MSLNDRIEFDCPFRVDADGNVTDAHEFYAPTVYDEEIDSDRWEFFSAGYTGQYGYNGPVMHNSEILSGRLESDILETPGVYVIVACDWSCDDDCETCGDSDVYDGYAQCDNVEGWAVLKLIED